MHENLDIFLTFLKLGGTTFGGGYAMMAQLKELIVDKKQWLTDDELLELCGIAESTPGPIAINMATYVGYKRGKFLGSVLATLGVVLPSFVIIFLISLFFNSLLEYPVVNYAFQGIKCAIAFLIIKAAVKMIRDVKKTPLQIILLLSTATLMIIFNLFAINFSSIFLILIGGIIALLISFIVKEKSEQ